MWFKSPRYRYYDSETTKYERNVKVLEKNGHLRLVEYEDGRQEWVAHNELDKEQ